MTTNPVMTITDEQIAEIERMNSELVELKCAVRYIRVDEVEGIISRLRAAEKDAERIEWLASQCEMRYGHREHAQYSADFGIFFQSDRDQCRPCDFRAAIDTAMKGDQQ